MMLSSRRLARPFFLEAEFLASGSAIGWSCYAYGTRIDMAQRPNFSGLAFMSDDTWAMLGGLLGAVQLACVLVNTRWGRWLVALPLSVFWTCLLLAIWQSTRHGEEWPLSAGLYVPLAACMLMKVARLPREYPPNA